MKKNKKKNKKKKIVDEKLTKLFVYAGLLYGALKKHELERQENLKKSTNQ